MPFSCSGNVTDAIELFPGDGFGVVSPDVVEPLGTIRSAKPVNQFIPGTQDSSNVAYK